MFAGIEKLAKIVIPTLGPKGKNIALKSEFSDPVIINDGVTIAKEVELEDPVENLGATNTSPISNSLQSTSRSSINLSI